MFVPTEKIKEIFRRSPPALCAAVLPAFIICRILTGKAAIRVGLWLLNGPELHSGHDLTIAFSGTEQNKNYWARIAFSGSCEEQYLGRYWCWEVPRIIKSLEKKADIVAEQQDIYLSIPPGSSGSLYIPVSVEGDMELALINFLGESMRKDVRRIKRNGFQYEIESDQAVLEDFVDRIHLAYLKNRYAGEYIWSSFRQITRDCQWTVGLFVTKENRRVAGELLYSKRGRISCKCLAIFPGAEELVKEGSLMATDYYTWTYLSEKGIPKMSFGGSRPFFHDGVLTWKKKWGLRLTRSGALVQRVRVIHDRPGARSFLINNPCIVTDRGELSGTVFVHMPADAALQELDKLSVYVWPGLKRVIVYCFDQIPAAAAAVSERHQGKIIFRSAGNLFASPYEKK